MNRQTALVTGLIVVLVLVLFWFFAWRPQSERIAEIETQREQVEAQQVQLQQRIARLEQVRRDAPQVEAGIVAAESIVPRELAVPSAIRQLQTAADDSGVRLVSLTWDRPAPVEGTPDLHTVAVAAQLEGSYFETVDFLRRVEDPAITPRGFVWRSLSVSPSEYPILTINLSGTMYAVLPSDAVPQQPPVAEPGEGEADVEVEVQEGGDQ